MSHASWVIMSHNESHWGMVSHMTHKSHIKFISFNATMFNGSLCRRRRRKTALIDQRAVAAGKKLSRYCNPQYRCHVACPLTWNFSGSIITAMSVTACAEISSASAMSVVTPFDSRVKKYSSLIFRQIKLDYVLINGPVALLFYSTLPEVAHESLTKNQFKI